MFLITILLVFMAIFFLLLSIDLDPLYQNSYGPSRKYFSCEARLYNYLTYIKKRGGVFSFKKGENYIMAWKEVEDGLLISPSDPCRWREKLWTRNDKVFRIVVNCLGVVYFVMLFVILSYQDDVVYIGEIENASPLLFCMGLLPPFIYFYRRFNRDRLTQGFLDGYVEGYCDAFDEYKQKHNIVTDKLVAKIDERNEY